jgi:CBS domain containing-hemolysin-like protein
MAKPSLLFLLPITLALQIVSVVCEYTSSPSTQQREDNHRRLEDPDYVDKNDDYFLSNEDYAEGYLDGYADANEEGDSFYYKLFNIAMANLCVLVAAIMAGLLMGMMSLNPLLLQVRAQTAPTDRERKQAAALVPFLKRKNLLLVSILIVNCATNEALPIFLDALLPAYIAIFLSTTLVVFVGEIFPSAYFTGQRQISLSYRLLPVVRLVICITLPISYPLSRLLDAYIHDDENEEENVPESGFRRREISAYVRLKHEERTAREFQKQHRAREAARLALEQGGCSVNLPDESLCKDWRQDLPQLLVPKGSVWNYATVQCGGSHDDVLDKMDTVDVQDVDNIDRVLTFREKLAMDALTPLHRVYAIPSQQRITPSLVLQVYAQGYSRVPVYQLLDDDDDDSEVSNIVGILLTKQFMVVDQHAHRTISTLPLYRPPCVAPSTNMSDLLTLFRHAKRTESQLAMVCVRPQLARDALSRGKPIPKEAQVLGIITLHDVLLHIVGFDVRDEKDRKLQAPLERAKWAVAKWKALVLRRRLERQDAEAFDYQMQQDEKNDTLREIV